MSKDLPTIYELNWEMEKIGIKAGKVYLEHTYDEVEWKEMEKQWRGYELVVINNLGSNFDNNLMIGNVEKCFVSEINIQFEKRPTNSLESRNEDITVENNKPIDEDLLRIAAESFKFSRFIYDPNFNCEASKLVYVDWTKNSFNREDKYFIIFSIEKKSVGYLLFSINNSIATIELIAVDNNYKNRKIGKGMIVKLENFLSEKCNEVKLIRVGTQGENEQAIKFYQNNGFKVAKVNTIYHYWNRN